MKLNYFTCKQFVRWAKKRNKWNYYETKMSLLYIFWREIAAQSVSGNNDCLTHVNGHNEGPFVGLLEYSYIRKKFGAMNRVLGKMISLPSRQKISSRTLLPVCPNYLLPNCPLDFANYLKRATKKNMKLMGIAWKHYTMVESCFRQIFVHGEFVVIDRLIKNVGIDIKLFADVIFRVTSMHSTLSVARICECGNRILKYLNENYDAKLKFEQFVQN